MKAAVCTAYGGPEVIQIRDVPLPVVDAEGVLIRVHATTLSSADARIRGARFPAGLALPARLALGVRCPRKPVLGTELSGVVERVGSAVTRLRPGDRVIAYPGAKLGAHATHISVPETSAIVAMPDGLAFDEAAVLAFGGTTALFFLRDKAQVKAGERVLINGGSGAVGTAAIQLARHFNCQVTAVCSAANADLVSALGATGVIDYRTTDFTRAGGTWDVILDTVGTLSYATCSQLLSANGRLILIAAGLRDMVTAGLSRRDGKRVIAGPAPERRDDLAFLADLAAAGHYRAVIDSHFDLDDIVQAHARVDSGRKVGNVVVRVTSGA